MELKDLKVLVKLLTDHDIAEFEMQQGEDRVTIRRGATHNAVTAPAPAVTQAPASAVAAAPVAVVSAPVVIPSEEGLETINSPMVGTFYRKPSPEAEYFTAIGAIVEPGQTLCLVEAMKLFNEIEAEFKCRVVEILKDDAQPVEYGEPLFKVKRV